MERPKLWVCERCLMAIESKEGNQATLRHDIDLECDPDDVDAYKCDWCGENEFNTLYELV